MKRRCSNCGGALAKGASFCRMCGAQYAAPAAPPTGAPTQAGAHSAPAPGGGAAGRRNQVAISVGIAILVLGAGAGVAILLATGGGSSTTTVVRSAAPAAEETAGTAEEPTAAAETAGSEAGSPIAAGRYIQAGSFQTAAHAEEERQRLADHGVYVEVVSSDSAEELYPGFRVLLGGPLRSHAAEAGMLRGLHHNGVPSAFARELTPATDGGPVAGQWTGKVERTSAEHPNLDGALPVTVTIASDEATGSLDFSSTSCEASLSLTSTVDHVLTYSLEPACAGAGPLRVRSLGGELMLTLLAPRTDAFALGTVGPS